MNVESLLKLWKLDSYAEIFEEEGFDLETLLCISDAENSALKTIIKKAGDRIRLVSKIDELKRAKVVELPEATNGDEDGTVSIEFQVNDDVDPQHEEQLVNDTAAPQGERPKKRKVTSSAQKTVKSILDASAAGERVRNNYSAGAKLKPPQGLTAKFQNLLVTTIIDHEMHETNISIPSDRFVKLSEEIVDLFPLEVKSTYFVPYKAVKIAGKVVSKKAAKGKLWNKYNNYCKKLIFERIRSSSQQPGHSTRDIASASSNDTDATILWLSGQLEITDRVVKEWKATSAVRIALLRSARAQAPKYVKDGQKAEVSEIMSKFPFLKQRKGFSLLEEDFDFLYPHCQKAIFNEWDEFATKVKEFTGVTTAISHASVLMEFARLVAKEQRLIRVNKKWVANEAEIIEGFLLHIKVIDELKNEIDRIGERAAKNKLQVSPFAVIVGVDTEHIIDSYLVVDGIQYRASTPLHAIDQTFKAVHALHVQYSAQSEVIWLLFQRLLYKLETVWDGTFPAVEKLLQQFEIQT